MKKSFFAKCLRVVTGIALIGVLAGCPNDSDNSGKTGKPEGSTVKLNLNGQQVIHTMWGEPEEDPRTVIGYELEDGTPYFDHYVMLYGFRLLDHDCATDPLKEDDKLQTVCKSTGLHIHFGEKIYNNYLKNYNKYIKPVQDKGIKVLMSIVPQDSGVAVGTLYRWPMAATHQWPSGTYPYGEEAVARLIAQMKGIFAEYPFDGIAYDEEYGNNKTGLAGPGAVYPSEPVYNLTAEQQDAAWKIGGENLLRFAYEVEKAIGKDLVQEAYEIRYGNVVAEEYTYTPAGGVKTTIRREDVIDYAYEAYYGNWQRKSNSGMPNNKFGPASVSIADVSGGPKPPPGKINGGVFTRMADHLRGNYGVVMYYCLRSRDEINARWPNYFGAGNPPVQDYLSQISETLHGQKTTYVGADYPRVW